MALRIAVTAFTHRGKVRDHNEDAIGIGPWQATARMDIPSQSIHSLDPPVLCLVADGMGGHAAGEHASSLAARSLAERACNVTGDEEVVAMLQEVNRKVFDAARTRSELMGMGTTVAGCIFTPEAVCWFNVGDSRIYRYRDGFARQLSIDDVSLRGKAKETQSHIITQALGGAQNLTEITPHVGRDPLVRGWRYLLCSDGLTNHAEVSGIQDILADSCADREAVKTLFQRAMDAGGHDNISIMLVRIEGADDKAAQESEGDDG